MWVESRIRQPQTGQLGSGTQSHLWQPSEERLLERLVGERLLVGERERLVAEKREAEWLLVGEKLLVGEWHDEAEKHLLAEWLLVGEVAVVARLRP